MKQRSSPSFECEPSLDRAEVHSKFSIRPFDPLPSSSPPPTSPLPPLPEIAPYSHESSPSILSPIQPIFTMVRPVRPPRPQTSLPNLKPRTITSPEISQRQPKFEIEAQARSSPTPTSRCQKNLQAEGRNFKLPVHLEPPKSLTLTLESASRFSDEILGALSKLFDKLSSSHSSETANRVFVEKTERIEPWRVYHGRLVSCPSKTLSLEKAPGAIARSTLFIPKTPPEKTLCVIPATSRVESCPPRAESSCYVIQSGKRNLDQYDALEREAFPSLRQDHPARACHKRSQAVTSFSFDFDKSYASGSSPMTSESGEHLTSLPRIPSDPSLFVETRFDRGTADVKVSFARKSTFRGGPEEVVAFAALPYADTLHSAGPRPKTEKDIRVRFENTDCDVEVGNEEGGGQSTDEHIQFEKRKRILWAIATIALVITSTSGILAGIVWKLRSLK